MKDKLRIAVITSDQALAGNLEIRLQSKGHQALLLTRLSSVLGFVYSDPSDIIIIDLSVSSDTRHATPDTRFSRRDHSPKIAN